MKFAKLLHNFATPDLADQDDRFDESKDFLSYKRLKKLLKAAAECRASEGDVCPGMKEKSEGMDDSHQATDTKYTEAERVQVSGESPTEYIRMTRSISFHEGCEYEKEFVRLLKEDVARINSYFMEQEEDCVIKLQDLQDRCESMQRTAESSGTRLGEDGEKLRSEFVDLHGELVLLLHWSIVNYAGILKILKKHDKLLGGDAQKSFMGSLLLQPFTSTESINRLVGTAEDFVRRRSAADYSSNSVDGVSGTDNCCSQEHSSIDRGNMRERENTNEATILRRTRAALGMLKELQTNAHSPSTFVSIENQYESTLESKKRKMNA